jgi:hypothetical protein
MSGLDSDGNLPGGCLSHVNRSALQSGTACQVQSAAASTKASAGLALVGISQAWTNSV